MTETLDFNTMRTKEDEPRKAGCSRYEFSFEGAKIYFDVPDSAAVAFWAWVYGNSGRNIGFGEAFEEQVFTIATDRTNELPVIPEDVSAALGGVKVLPDPSAPTDTIGHLERIVEMLRDSMGNDINLECRREIHWQASLELINLKNRLKAERKNKNGISYNAR